MTRKRTRNISATVHLHPAQAAFRHSPVLYRALVGGRGSGKTWCGAYDLLRRARSGRTYLVVSPTYTLLEDTTLPTFLALSQRLGIFRGLKITPRPSVKLACGRGKPRATVRFRSAEEPDKLRGGNLSGIWLDEASLMDEAAYLICIACLREQGEQGFLTATFTPRGRGHWSYRIFGADGPDVALYHARTDENPFLPEGFMDHIAAQYTTEQQRQELLGLFVDLSGCLFKREWFDIVDAVPAALTRVRRWDLAGTEAKAGADPDWTAGVLLGMSAEGRTYVLDVRRVRATPHAVEALVRQTAELDGRNCAVRMEQEPGSSGLAVIDHYGRNVLAGFDFKGVRSTGDKAERARPLAASAEAGNVQLLAGQWTRAFLDEVESFPAGGHDDQVDAASGAFLDLTQLPRPGATIQPGPSWLGQVPPGVFGGRGGLAGKPPPGVYGRARGGRT